MTADTPAPGELQMVDAYRMKGGIMRGSARVREGMFATAKLSTSANSALTCGTRRQVARHVDHKLPQKVFCGQVAERLEIPYGDT
jgi:hypothetical protein